MKMSSASTKKGPYSFLIYTLGCKVNHYDSASLRSRLLNMGFAEPVSGQKKEKNENLDLLIVNTCTVTKKAITKDKHLIAELSRLFPTAKIIVMGCWPETDEQVKDYFSEKDTFNNRDLYFWGVGDLDALALKIEKLFFANNLKKLENNSSINLASTDRSRYFLKVADGCNQFCSYCIIPFARGRLKSRDSKELCLEIERAICLGFKEFVLTGIHLGRYGEDNDKELNLVELLKKFLQIKGVGRLRLSSIEINEVTLELIELMSIEKRICPHLHISLQSGSDSVLKAMKRPYDRDYFFERANLLRKNIPDVAISTDIIVGFPGESEKDFNDSFNFAKQINFSKIHVFPFSAHEKTPAYKMKEKIRAKEIKKRAKSLRDLSLQLEQGYKEKILNKYKEKSLEVVLENTVNKNKLKGKTEFSFDLEFSQKDIINLDDRKISPGDIIELKI